MIAGVNDQGMRIEDSATDVVNDVADIALDDDPELPESPREEHSLVEVPSPLFEVDTRTNEQWASQSAKQLQKLTELVDKLSLTYVMGRKLPSGGVYSGFIDP